jgi:glucose/arabinose dehydrogenase
MGDSTSRAALETCMSRTRRFLFAAAPLSALWLLAVAWLTGCATGPHVLPIALQKTIDRHITEYPSGFELKPYIVGLDSPTGFCFDEANNIIIAEGGIDGDEPRIFGIHPDGTRFNIYPSGTRIPVFHPGFSIYGPIGGLVYNDGRILASHRDKDDMGVITSFGYDGSHKTVVSGLPAQGDFGVTDLAISPIDGRLYFGVGAATNSGVVGPDNIEEGWVDKHPNACDLPLQQINLLGYRFGAENPKASIFTPSISVTVPFQPFGISDIIQILAVAFPVEKPTGAILSVSPDGGDLRAEAWGVRNPVGVAIDDYNSIWITDQGMELRGTRPIASDQDALYQIVTRGAWLGWPDYSRSLDPVSLGQFQPPPDLLKGTGYPKVSAIIDQQASHLQPPDKSQLRALFENQSGAAKIAFFPASGPFHRSPYEGELLVALWGDRAPFSTGGDPLPEPRPGYRVVRVKIDSRDARDSVKDFIYNTQGMPASQVGDGTSEAIERPIDLKFGPEGTLYILDFGRAKMKHGHLKVSDGTGKILILTPSKIPPPKS